MFPEVHRRSLIALKKFCANKNIKRTAEYIDSIWDSDAHSVLMIKTRTNNLNELARWLTSPDNDTKIALINKVYKI